VTANRGSPADVDACFGHLVNVLNSGMLALMISVGDRTGLFGTMRSMTDRGRYGWSGGQGTDFFVDADGTVGILFTQFELGAQMWNMLGEFQTLHQSSR
jgi:hypothetical protein